MLKRSKRSPPRRGSGLASRLHSQLDRNVDELYDGTLTHEKFDQRQGEVWGRIRAAGVADQVLARIRAELTGSIFYEAKAGASVTPGHLERDVSRLIRGR